MAIGASIPGPATYQPMSRGRKWHLPAIIARMSQPLTQQRIRITFGKNGPLRYVGHLDLARTWERVLRRAGVPLEYSQGFTPRPRMQFAAALPVGVSSACEYLDAWLTARLDGPPSTWVERLQAASPHGLTVLAVEDVPIRGAALPTLVTHAEYVVTPLDPALDWQALRDRIEALLAAGAIERVRSNGKRYDLRPLIRNLAMTESGDIVAELVTGDEGTARIDEVVDALGMAFDRVRAHRTRLVLREEPVP